MQELRELTRVRCYYLFAHATCTRVRYITVKFTQCIGNTNFARTDLGSNIKVQVQNFVEADKGTLIKTEATKDVGNTRVVSTHMGL